MVWFCTLGSFCMCYKLPFVCGREGFIQNMLTIPFKNCTCLLSPLRVVLPDTQPAGLPQPTAVKTTVRILDSGPFLLTCGGTFHTKPRDRPSQRRSEPTTYILWWSSVWTQKEAINHSTEESEAETEREGERSLWTQLLQPAPLQTVHHSLKHTHYHHWSVKLML